MEDLEKENSELKKKIKSLENELQDLKVAVFGILNPYSIVLKTILDLTKPNILK